MKPYIMATARLLILLTFSGLAYSQDTKVISKVNAATNLKSDSTDLKALVINLLRWHENDKKSDFEPLLKNPKDTIYSGIDWQLYKKRVIELKNTNLFTKDFLDNYQKIALHLDKELKQNKVKYAVGDLPPYDHSNEWCNCQDYPSNIWKRLKIVSLKINDNSANFKWTWGDNFFYSTKARKENNVWRISALEKFNLENFSW